MIIKVKNDNFEILKTFGFSQSKVANFPQKLFKIVDIDKKYIIEVCNDSERSYNMWSGKDWKDVGVLKLWECRKLELDYKWRDGIISPYYERDRTHNELLINYIQDLINAEVVGTDVDLGVIETSLEAQGIESGYYTVCCSAERKFNEPPRGCGASSGYYPTKEEAIEKWNRREGKQ